MVYLHVKNCFPVLFYFLCSSSAGSSFTAIITAWWDFVLFCLTETNHKFFKISKNIFCMEHEAFCKDSTSLSGIFFNWSSLQARLNSHNKVWKKSHKKEKKKLKNIEWICSINTCHSNTNRKDLTQLHFEGEQRVWKKQKVKVQQSYISVSVVHQTYPSSSWKHQPIYDNSIQSHMVYLQR